MTDNTKEDELASLICKYTGDSRDDTITDLEMVNLLYPGMIEAIQATYITRAEHERLVLDGKIDLISWCLSRTSMDELKQRFRELEDELAQLSDKEASTKVRGRK